MNQVAPSTPPPRFYSRTRIIAIFGIGAVTMLIGSMVYRRPFGIDGALRT